MLSGPLLPSQAQSAATKAAPPNIPTVSLNDVARHGFFYAGGKYVGQLGRDKESTMGGAMYVEVMVPKQVRSPYPVVFFHGAGQTGVDWLQTPDGRPGWAYNFLDMGYVVYLTDFPTRGRSQYVPGVDGTVERPNLNIRTAPNLEEIRIMVTAEPGGPQFGGADTAKVTAGPRQPNSWGLTNNRFEYSPPASSPADLNVVLQERSDRPDEVRCWMQVEPARKLARWQGKRVLAISANGTYHRVYDPCIPKFLNQAGVKTDFVRLEDVGLSGNGHMMMLEKNSDGIIKFVIDWLQKNIGQT